MVFLFAVDVFEVEALRRHSEGIQIKMVDFLHHFVFERTDLRLFAFGGELMGVVGEFADGRVDEEVDLAGVVGLLGLGEAVSGH